MEYRSTGAIRVVDNTTYENELTTYGETGAFVISGNDLRLPKITRYLRSIDNTVNIGNPLPAGLPNLYGSIGKYEEVMNGDGVLFTNIGHQTHGSTFHKSGGRNTNTGVDFNASRYNGIYGRSDSVQPPSVQVALYIQVYHATVPASTAETARLIDQISALSNQVTQLTQQLNTIKNSNFGAPNHAGRVDLTPEASATTISYTATSNGYICGFYMRQNDGATQINLTIDGVTYTNWSRPGSYYVNGHMSVCMPVKKGSVIVITRTSGNWNSSLNWTYFVPTE